MTKCLYANFRFMFACLNPVEIFCNDIIFCNLWFYAHVWIWRNAWCMTHIRDIFIFVRMFRFWRDVFDDYVFRNFRSYLHVWIILIFIRMFQFERNVLTIDLCFAFDSLHYMWKYTQILTRCLRRFYISQSMISSQFSIFIYMCDERASNSTFDKLISN